jgi:hypothetical protein
MIVPTAKLLIMCGFLVRDQEAGGSNPPAPTTFAYTGVVRHPPMTVVETVRFLNDADGFIAETERARLVEFIGRNPEAGDLIPETRGVRKLRWALPGKGKRGGARLIYFFHNERLPVFLLAMYGKSEKTNLS